MERSSELDPLRRQGPDTRSVQPNRDPDKYAAFMGIFADRRAQGLSDVYAEFALDVLEKDSTLGKLFAAFRESLDPTDPNRLR